MSQHRPRRIGIHGIRGAGKTCYLGTLYGFRSANGLKINVVDESSLAYLSSVWKQLQSARAPGDTLSAFLHTLRLELNQADYSLPLELADYSGLLVQPRNHPLAPTERELTLGVKQWLHGCHAVLLFLDCSNPDMEQMDALDLLLAELRRPNAAGVILDRPLALVLTKWDRQGTIGDDPAREQHRARLFLGAGTRSDGSGGAHHVFQQILAKLGDDQGRQVRLFAVSSFGNGALGDAPPSLSDYRPCHLYDPLLWAAQASDHTLFEETRLMVEQHLAGWWPDYGAARREWLKLRPEVEALCPEIDDELRRLGDRRGRYWSQALLPLGAVVLLLMVAGWVGAREASVQADAVIEFVDANPTRDQAADRLERCEAFLASWLSWLVVAPRQRIAEQADTDRRAVAEQTERDGMLERLTAQEKAGEWSNVLATVRDYLDRYPDTPLAETLRLRQHQAAQEAASVTVRADATILEEKNRFADALKLYQAFLADYPASPWKNDINHRLAMAQRRHEEFSEYDPIRQLVAKGDGLSLEQAGIQAVSYLKSRPTGTMRVELERYRAWLERLRQGGQFNLIVESVQVMPGCSLLSPLPLVVTRPKVHLTLNGVSHSSGWLNGSQTTPYVKLGPFPFTFGQEGRLLVRVEAERFNRQVPAARYETSDKRFILGQVNTTLTARCVKNGEVVVGLRCDDANPPTLPAYRHN